MKKVLSQMAKTETGESREKKRVDADAELIRRAQQGDKRAFDLLVKKYQNRIVQLVSRYVKDPTEALDIAQETFLKAYRALPRFRGESAFYTWLYRIAINTAKNHLSARSRRPAESEVELSESEQYEMEARLKHVETPEEIVMSEEVARAVQEAIEALPEELKTAIILRELEGLSYEEIAQVMGCPVGTVRSRIFRAREAIDKKLRELSTTIRRRKRKDEEES